MALASQEQWRGNERVNPLAESCLVAQRGPCQEETADSCLLLNQGRGRLHPSLAPVAAERQARASDREQQRHWERGYRR